MAADARQDMISCVALSADPTTIGWTAPGGALQIGDTESGRVCVLVDPGKTISGASSSCPPAALYAATFKGELFEIALRGAMRLICDGIPQASTFVRGHAIAAEVRGDVHQVEPRNCAGHTAGASAGRFGPLSGPHACQTTRTRYLLPKGDDVKAAVMLGQRTSHLGPHEVTATYPGALAESFVIDGERVAPGQPLVRRHPPVSAL